MNFPFAVFICEAGNVWDLLKTKGVPMGLRSKLGIGKKKSTDGLLAGVGPVSESSSPMSFSAAQKPGDFDNGASSPRSVSVIIPVYNAMPYLTELLNSLEAQDLASTDFDVIAVDDGSTDFSGEILDVYAARNANFRVIHQENSGWPGKPRNVGIEASRSEFVFFCDADDHLGPEALRRMVDFARAHSSDVVVPKMIGVGGRRVQASLFTKTVEDVPLRTILRSLSPQKLVRRSLLLENNIRFHEEKVRLEDGIVMSACYLKARKTSILADYDYYFIRTRTVGTNISSAPIEPAGYVRSLTEISKNLLDGVQDRDLADLLVLDLFKRKGLRFYEPARFLAMAPRVQKQWVVSHAAFIDRFLPAESQQKLDDADRELTALIHQQDLDAILATVKKRESVNGPMETVEARASGDGVSFRLSSLAPLSSADLVLKNRTGTKQKTFDVEVDGSAVDSGRNLHTVSISADDLKAFGKEIIDVWTVARDAAGQEGAPARTTCPAGVALPPPLPGIRVYATVHGSLSLDLRK
ncbi:glycosyltransferase [Paeniglutamicibacter sp. ZC-3]|uniref:glycosyltransferase family 2 protein n=1 Tax=Paeniglutamicibacter sp. ZC-3 TaxID=2986919 RepID=UPI0021F6A74E|nr:glycosyltransferase family 2 protein [Paeniglutamicibacter sp. ZC-3]MCV9994452.1 glycosyltransferase [Paeniglutamicibacter sp. ZC-3]